MDVAPDTALSRSSSRSVRSKVFSGRRHRKGDSTPSLAPAEDQQGGLRLSLDEALGKLRQRANSHTSADSGRGSVDSPRRFSALFKRRARKGEAAESDTGSTDGDVLGGAALDLSPSDESLQLHKSVASSLLTEDESDSEAPPARPSLSPHQSHAGYLTLSSPLIASLAVKAPSVTKLSSDESTPPPDDTLAPKNASTLQPEAKERRGSSPGRKLKGAFGPRKSPSPKGTTESLKTTERGGGGGGLGSLFAGGKKSRSSSKVSLVEEALQDSVQDQQREGQQAPPSLKRIETPPINTSTALPETPPTKLIHAPTTVLTPPTPTDLHAPPSLGEKRPASSSKAEHNSTNSNPNVVVTPSGSLVHRRARSATTNSNPPSKLSHVATAPLTPTLEETKTPGGTLTQPPTGFFSSVFSAAQNAASSLGNITSINQNQKSKAPPAETENIGPAGGEEVVGGASEQDKADSAGTEKKQLAVETLGSGNLSLSHLGFSEADSDSNPMASATELAEARPITPTVTHADEASARAEDSAAAKAVSEAYLQGPPDSAALNGDRPRSLSGLSETQTPQKQLGEEGETRLGRSGSVRSRFSDRNNKKGKRRHRGSSATTTTAHGPTQTNSTTTLPSTNTGVGNGSKLTGFAVASRKRNRDFHNQFRSVPEDDYLIDDYSAALQRDILLHGRLYVSEGHICFSSNILGWVTNLVISFDEVVSVEKKSTAVIFPNAIVITTLHARNVFASLVSRDSTYDLLVGIWKISHPNLKSSLNGVALDAGTGDKTEKADSPDALDDGSEEGSEEEVYDEDDDDDDGAASFTGPSEGSIAGSEAEPIKSVSRKPSANPISSGAGGGAVKDASNGEAVAAGGAAGGQDFPGPATHGPTECGDEGEHFSNVLIDTTIPAPLGKVYSLMFGPASGSFMRKWLIEDQKSLELTMEDDKKGLGEDRKTMSFSYIKPLNASIGPKQTKCIINSTLDQFDLDKAVTVTCSTQNPDVPNGNIFVVKTKYCLTWAPGNSTRLNMNFVIEWSGKSWLKGPIEKGTNDGQGQYAKDLVAALKAAVAAKGSSKGGAKGGKKGGKRRKETSSSPTRAEASAGSSPPAAEKASDWGVLEPLHGPLRPITDMLPEFISAQFVIAILLFLMFISWLRSPSTAAARGGYGAHGSLGVPGLATPARIVAYEEMWRREESELWDWLEERVRLDRAAAGTPLQSQSSTSTRNQQVKQMGERLDSDVRMSQRQIEEAIRVTQERLEVLKDAVEKKRPAAAAAAAAGASEAEAAASEEQTSSSSPVAA
ncbi:GRAM domain-containing protein [Macrophomina phaseolina MS6]|uniref:GRAM domain-containing protein n=1 Tax=Macrophomina phaseolina (strain MS6) TaxID=1126212 RepID=K2SND8_MACPH|nr:GRAM domain-containing protein [Macrophomina phaseolina MS6]